MSVYEQQVLRNIAPFPTGEWASFLEVVEGMGQPESLLGRSRQEMAECCRAMLGGVERALFLSCWPKAMTIPWGQPHSVGNPVGLFNCGGQARQRWTRDGG